MKELKNQIFKNQNAITLIALVITIVVLLILAGVTIVTLIGDNGLLTKAGEAKNTTESAAELEKIELAVIAAQDKKNFLSKDSITNSLINYFGNDVKLTENAPWIFEGAYNNYFIYEDGNVKIKEDYSKLSIGDYINYPVKYENLFSYNNQYKPKDEYSGWRILSIDTQNNTVRIVSAGIPLTYYAPYDNTIPVQELNNNFLNINFNNYGFKDSNNNFIDNSSNLLNLFTNKYTSTQNEIPQVSSLKKEDIQAIIGNLSWGSSVKSNDLFAIPCNNLNEGDFSFYWLSSPYLGKQQLWAIYNDGNMKNQNGQTLGIRPVVTLKGNIQFNQDVENSSDNRVVWNINF